MNSTGATPSMATWVNCLIGSYGSLGTVNGPIDVRRGIRQHQRVAVGCGTHHLQPADGAAGARLVVDDHRLAERLGERLGDGARHDVARAAGREGDDDAHRLLGPCGQRGAGASARRGEHDSGAARDGSGDGHAVCLRVWAIG